jgi:hypothetical protein
MCRTTHPIEMEENNGGTAGELLIEPDGGNQTLWCPQCLTNGWVWD